ncbi:cytochrome-c peroxidase [Solemya velesiana gill symbiont]|uniref:cytochrome-c peroxidase n=1 Tax=Solemya velesiana gill symbiont TaxID=1918948 RepID=UPI001FE77B71|nr:cytochrome c peroxidase [Solemya velesiana gill symbiont]
MKMASRNRIFCDAIASFERTLITPDSPFDRWLRGDEDALNEREKEGYRLFKSYGCIACHQGVNVGGNMFQRMGAIGDYFGDRGSEIVDADRGRFNVTGKDEDLYFFKVPSLRLSAINSPYFHDGSAKDLAEAIRVMGSYQLGRRIPEAHVSLIVAFLESLVGSHPGLRP